MEELWALVLNHRDYYILFNILEIIMRREIFYAQITRHLFSPVLQLLSHYLQRKKEKNAWLEPCYMQYEM